MKNRVYHAVLEYAKLPKTVHDFEHIRQMTTRHPTNVVQLYCNCRDDFERIVVLCFLEPAMLRNIVSGPLVEIYPVNDTKQRSKLRRAMDGIIKDLCDERGFDVPDLTKNMHGPLMFKKKSLVNRVGDLEDKVNCVGDLKDRVAELENGLTAFADSSTKQSAFSSQRILAQMEHSNRQWDRVYALEKHIAHQFNGAKSEIDRSNQRIDETNHRFSRHEFETVQFQSNTTKRMDQSDKRCERLHEKMYSLEDGLADVVRRLTFCERVTGGTVTDMDTDRLGTDYGIGDSDRFNGCSSRSADFASGMGFTAYNALKYPSGLETNNKEGDTFMDTD